MQNFHELQFSSHLSILIILNSFLRLPMPFSKSNRNVSQLILNFISPQRSFDCGIVLMKTLQSTSFLSYFSTVSWLYFQNVQSFSLKFRQALVVRKITPPLHLRLALKNFSVFFSTLLNFYSFFSLFSFFFPLSTLNNYWRQTAVLGEAACVSSTAWRGRTWRSNQTNVRTKT